jgi:hypothetical protein
MFSKICGNICKQGGKVVHLTTGFEAALMGYSGAWVKLIHGKT